MAHEPKLPPDYSPGFKKLTGFRGTTMNVPHGHRTSVGNDIGTSVDKEFPGATGTSVKRSPIHPFPAGGKKPWTGKS